MYANSYLLTEGAALRMDGFATDRTYNGPGRDGLGLALLFVSGLGSYDDYRRRRRTALTTAPLSPDTLWRLERCL